MACLLECASGGLRPIERLKAAPQRPPGSRGLRPIDRLKAAPQRPPGSRGPSGWSFRLALLLMGLAGCGSAHPNERLDDGLPPTSARLLARPGGQVSRLAAGLHPLGLGTGRDGLLYVPTASQAGSVPLLVMLHGAGSSAGRMWESIRRDVGEGVAVLLPESRGWTWDFVHGDFGADLRFIDAALERTFATVPVDPRRIALAGFSAGGGMALSLGPSNGDLFSWVFAFAPTFMDAAGRVGRPRFFVAHGTADTVVPIDRSSRAIVPALRAGGYSVVYREMAGWPHAVAPEWVHEALSLLVEGS